ncbi:hypothetical protein PoB_002151400 [Plakobranchus ocellatus]|uniref:Uncharacterized protein n=1 Tax=Plakobranchus ocellatus TaxID=259542 RepID=A0AAV3ZI66_9GAST|nr:hypothetical protein PoB_002151400 [Plakobranchus ocellatus]
MSFTFDESEDVFQKKIYPSSRYDNPGRKKHFRRTAAECHCWDAILHFMVKHGNQTISQVLTQKGHINLALLIRQVKSGHSERAFIASWFNNQSQQGMLCCSTILDQKRHINGLWHKPSNSRKTHFTGGEEIDSLEQNQGLKT